MNEIVCQFSNREGQVELAGPPEAVSSSLDPIAGVQLGELREVHAPGSQGTRRDGLRAEPGRRRTGCLGAGLCPGRGRLSALQLPVAVRGRYRRARVRKWLEELRKQTPRTAWRSSSTSSRPTHAPFVSIPWNLVYDERPAKHKPAFQTGKTTERWRPFWSIRYNLTSGRRVEPLKRMPTWSDPRVIVVVDPDVYEQLRDDQKAQLSRVPGGSEPDDAPLAGGAGGGAVEEGYPRLLYWLGHANPDYLQLGPERVAPSDLRNLLRSFDDRERPEGMLAFLNCCQTAEGGQSGSFLDVLHSFGFTGAIATEQQTIDNFANELGLAFLRGFLQEGRPLGELLHGLRLSMAPLALLYGAALPARHPREDR